MGWTEEDVKRIQEKYGNAAKVTLDDDKTQNIKIDEKSVDRQLFLDLWMMQATEQEVSILANFTVFIEHGQDFDMVKTVADKHGLQLMPIEGEPGRYKITLKDTPSV